MHRIKKGLFKRKYKVDTMFSIPTYVYKFKSFDAHWRDIFENLRLYMATPKEENDPFEGQLIPIVVSTAGGSISTAAGKLNGAIEGNFNQYRILSLSANIRNKAMWAHYSSNYSGFAIQFKTANTFSKVERVIYKPDSEKVAFKNIDLISERDDIYKQALLYKSEDWIKEHEFRIIEKSQSVDEKRFFRFNIEDVESIVLGVYIEKENKKEILNFAKSLKIKVRYMWTVPIKARIEFYSDGNEPKFDGSSYQQYIDKDI